MIFLLFAGIERFTIEFLRPNPRIVLGLSEAQLIAFILMLIGLIGWWKLTTSSQATKTK